MTFSGIWQTIKDHRWALGEALKTYRAALEYAAFCQEQAEVHYANQPDSDDDSSDSAYNLKGR